MLDKLNNFTVIDSVYGKFVVNRHCAFQAEALIKTGKPHIDEEVVTLMSIASTLPEGAIVVDAGANIGLISVPLADMLKPSHGAVFAFEVQRMMYYALCGAAALNDLENLFVMNLGLGSSTSEGLMGKLNYDVPQDFGMFSLLEQEGPKTERIQMVTVDSFGFPRLDLLKIDVEGMEIDVLQGARASIAKYRPWVWVEYWKVSVEAIKAQFEGLDYEIYGMDHLNLLCAPSDRLAQSGLTIEAPKA